MRSTLLRWYRRHRRDLPWRRTRNPYAIWVSEIMLQQTRVETVLPYYASFLERFPDPHSLAESDEEEVLARWSGLGYYRRARALRAGARAVVERHGGELPADAGALRSLPGIGRYTAGAIASIAFDLPEPILDGNVRRVLSRLHLVESDRTRRAETDKQLWELAERLVSGPHPGDLNQALMELGALVCTPRRPDCAACPVRRHCRAEAAGAVDRVPTPARRQPTERVRVAVALVSRGGRAVLERPGKDSPLRGAWDLPAVEVPDDAVAEPVLRDALDQRHGLEVGVGSRLGSVSHSIMNRRLTLELYRCRLRRGRVAGRTDLRWLVHDAVGEAAVSGATRKLLRTADRIDRPSRSAP